MSHSRNFKFQFCITLTVLLAGVLSAPYAAADERADLIEQSLDCVSLSLDRNPDLRWVDVCYTDVPKPRGAGREELVSDTLIEEYADEQTLEDVPGDGSAAYQSEIGFDEDPEQDFDVDEVGRDQFPRHAFELGLESYAYKYVEEDINVKTTGIKGGMQGSYTYRFFDNTQLHSWREMLQAEHKLNMVRLEGRLSYGEVDYEGSGTWGGIPEWNFETRALAGYEMIFPRYVITPYAGIGYRYLFNNFSKYPAGLVDGQLYASGYDRESHYLYVPIGAEARVNYLNSGWSLGIRGELDFFVLGRQISHFENSVGTSDESLGIDKMENAQKQGIGWRASLRLGKETKHYDLYVEPFVRYWHIEDSEFEFLTSSGAYICQGNLCQGGIEPDNKTWEYGANIGINF